MRFEFREHSLDIDRHELCRRGEEVAIEPQIFELLVYLLRNRDRVVSRDDLIAKVWGGRIVSDSAVEARIHAARRAVGDSGAAQRVIRTVPRKGVRFVAEVREYGADVSRVSDAEADRERTLATILFTDIVDSTKWAAKLGDRQWRALLDRHDDAFAAMRQSVRVAPIGVKTIRVLQDSGLSKKKAGSRPLACARGLGQ